jgi:hypothetical protein
LKVMASLQGFALLQQASEPPALRQASSKRRTAATASPKPGALRSRRLSARVAGDHRRSRFHVWTAPAAQVVC